MFILKTYAGRRLKKIDSARKTFLLNNFYPYLITVTEPDKMLPVSFGLII